jgi:hypothetical protein
LGESQYAWLKQTIGTEPAGAICVSGLNVLNTVYNQLIGESVDRKRDDELFETNCADFSGWQSYPTRQLLKLFGSREGVVTVYGDLHHGGISRNIENNVVEAHFGYIGTSGYLRSMKIGFAPRMKDFNGEEVEVISLYHQYFESPHLLPRQQREDGRRDAQNFLEMVFDPTPDKGRIQMRIRHLLDAVSDEPRGGGALDLAILDTGRALTCRFPAVRLLPDADVVFYSLEGRPIRGTRTKNTGELVIGGLVGVQPGTRIMVVCRNETGVDSRILSTQPL